jgi:SAM-dependent methyltransferase
MPVDYDGIAARFDQRYQYQSFPGIQARLRRLANRPGARVLEFGCGTGHWLKILDDSPVQLIGLDPSRPMLEKARICASKAGFVCASAEHIPFPARSFDLIFCVNAFHHFSDPNKFLRASRLLLRNDGRLAIFGLDPHAPNTNWYLYDYFPDVREKDLARYLPATEIRVQMMEAGFKDVKVESAEHIQKTFVDDAVFEDPFFARESTSQLLLIPEESYRQGKREIASAVENARREARSLFFLVDLRLFRTVGRTNGTK